jgi:hypothetical protein
VKAIFVTHNNYLFTFHLLEMALRKEHGLRHAGFYVSGKSSYKNFLSRASQGWADERPVLAEWDILQKAAENPQVDPQRFETLEKRYGDPGFWHVPLCDRRIFYEKKPSLPRTTDPASVTRR